MNRYRSPWQIWRAPACLGIASLVGLPAALFGGAVGDWISWVSLAAPLVVMGWYAGVAGQKKAGPGACEHRAE